MKGWLNNTINGQIELQVNKTENNLMPKK